MNKAEYKQAYRVARIIHNSGIKTWKSVTGEAPIITMLNCLSLEDNLSNRDLVGKVLHSVPKGKRSLEDIHESAYKSLKHLYKRYQKDLPPSEISSLIQCFRGY